MVIEIADNILEKAGLSKEEIRLELAILLFQREKVSLGQGGSIAGMHKLMFQKELAKRKISVHYEEEDFMKDLENLKLL